MCVFRDDFASEIKYSLVPVSADLVSAASFIHDLPEKKCLKIKELTVHKFQNARQARTDNNMVKSSSPNASIT
jgi:hypothetical protein